MHKYNGKINTNNEIKFKLRNGIVFCKTIKQMVWNHKNVTEILSDAVVSMGKSIVGECGSCFARPLEQSVTYHWTLARTSLYNFVQVNLHFTNIQRKTLNICRTLNGKEVNSKLFSKCWIIIAIRFLLLITHLALSINSLQNNFLHQPLLS